jgi:flagellar hook-length control protein FliK
MRINLFINDLSSFSGDALNTNELNSANLEGVNIFQLLLFSLLGGEGLQNISEKGAEENFLWNEKIGNLFENQFLSNEKIENEKVEEDVNTLVNVLINLFLFKSGALINDNGKNVQNFTQKGELDSNFSEKMVREFFSWLDQRLKDLKLDSFSYGKKEENFLQNFIEEIQKKLENERALQGQDINSLEVIKKVLKDLLNEDKQAVFVLDKLVKKELKEIMNSQEKETGKKVDISFAEISKKIIKKENINLQQLNNQHKEAHLVEKSVKYLEKNIKGKEITKGKEIKAELKEVKNNKPDEKLLFYQEKQLFEKKEKLNQEIFYSNKEEKITSQNAKKFYFNNKTVEIFINHFIHHGVENQHIVRMEHVKLVEDHKLSQEFLQFVKDFTMELLPEGEKKALIKLEPPELGSLHLEIKVKHKEVEIIAKVDRPEALHELKAHLHHIKNTLEEMGLNLKDFQLSLGTGFDSSPFAKEFDKSHKEKNFGKGRIGIEEIEGISSGAEETKEVFRNSKGNYYYIV